MLNIIVKVYPIIPIILLIVTLVTLYNAQNKLNNYVKCSGTIAGLHEDRCEARISDDATKMISPIIRYSVDGTEYEFVGTYYVNTMKVNDSIDILYNKSNPSEATMKNGLYVAPIITGGLALVFSIGYIVLIVLKSKGII